MPRNKHPEETVKKILDVSLKLFLEKGYEQTTVLDIVDNLGGLTRGAFYHHFKSKEEVLEAIFGRQLAENDPFEKAKNAKVSNGLERVRLAFKLAVLSNVESEQDFALSTLAVSLLANPRFLAEKIKSDQETAKLVIPMIEEGMKDGSIKLGNSKLLADLFMLLVNFWMFPTLYPCNREELQTKCSMITQIFESLGCPIIDNELGQLLFDVFESLSW